MKSLHDLIIDIMADHPSPGTLFIVLSMMKEDGRLGEVIQECNKALVIYPDNIRIRQLLTEAYLGSGQISLAESESDKVAEQLCKLISIFKIQADIYNRQGRMDEAKKALNIYLALRPDDPEALEALAELEPVKEYSGMNIPEDEGTLTEIATPTLAEIYLQQDQVMEAINTYQRILTRDPGDEQSALRLEELISRVTADEVPKEIPLNKVKHPNEKIVTILENWLLNIRRKTEITG